MHNITPHNSKKKMKISVIEPGGLNIELAILFADNGHDVAYYSEFHESFPTGQREKMGTGFKGVERVTKLSTALDYGDIIICPDTHSQDYLALAARYNKPTWGTGRAERLEEDRLFGKQMLKQLGLPVGPYKAGSGVDDLEHYLKSHDDLFIKFPGSFRGSVETKHHYDWKKTKTEWWGDLLTSLGPEMDNIEWIAEEPLKHIMEVAADQLVVNGEYSLPTLVGIEDKDSAYIGKIMDKVPDILQPTNDALKTYLRSCKAKCFFSPELMIGEDKKAYLTDPCLRTGHPVSACQLRVYGNLCDYIINNVYEMELHDIIEPTHTYAIALEIKSTDLEDSWLEIQFDPKERKNVHLQNARQVGDSYYVIPKSFIAATIVGLGNTVEEAEKSIAKTLESFSCSGMYYTLEAIQNIKSTMKKGKSVGINF